MTMWIKYSFFELRVNITVNKKAKFFLKARIKVTLIYKQLKNQ